LCQMLLASAVAFGQQSTIVTTVAGGRIGNHKPALSADFADPFSVAFDAKGNLYVSDRRHCQVRVIEKNGVITAFAGSEICGYGGDGGPARSALLSSPAGIAFDHRGNLLIADLGNNRIRMVTPSGTITTIAGNGLFGYSGDGGPASQASLGGPQSVFGDSSGNIYIADSANYVIRTVDPSGIIRTVAGTHVPGFGGAGDGGPATSAPIGYPENVVADTNGNFYIADASERVRKVDSSGIITTFAGNGLFPAGGNLGSGGPATSASIGLPLALLITGGKLYISTIAYIWTVDFATQTANIIAGTGVQGYGGDGQSALSATFNEPWGIAVNATGDLIVADSWNARLRRISRLTHIVSTIAGGFLGDGGHAGNSGLDVEFGGGIAFDAAGNLFIADSQNNRVRKVSDEGIITTFAGTGNSAYSGDGGPASLASLSDPTAVAVDGAGNVFIADAGNGVVRKVDTAGNISTFSRPGFTGLFSILPGLAVDGSGNVYVSDGLFGVWKIDPLGTSTLIAGTFFGVGFNGDGIPATQAELNLPAGVAVDSVGNIYIADWLNNRVRKVDTNGIISTVAGTGAVGYNGDEIPATSATLFEPTGVAADGKGNLYIADWIHFRIRVVDSSGIIHTYAGAGSGAYNGNRLPATASNVSPTNIAISPGGLIYFTDQGSFRVRRVQTR
jgi:sugar lactone lactonase YvrE